MRFASVMHGDTPLAVAIEDDTAVPIRGASSLGAGTPSALLADPPLDRLTLRTIVNGAVAQEAQTSHMIFDVPTLVSVISEFATLEPGDLILTGTPSGVGFRREPPLLLGPGDLVTVEIDGVGRLENRFVAERADPLASIVARD